MEDRKMAHGGQKFQNKLAHSLFSYLGDILPVIKGAMVLYFRKEAPMR
jgi:hypothetical protein